jgi:KaiC/GvpD/RAD55 family RecA-like ATPase
LLQSRESFEVVKQHVTNLKNYSKEFGILFKLISDYYSRDSEATSVHRDVLLEQVSVSLRNEKHLKDFTELVDDAILASASAKNVNQIILEAKKSELGRQLAQAIANDRDHKDLLEQYNQIFAAASLDEVLDRGLDIYETVDIGELIRKEKTDAEYIKLYPRSLNDRLGGGLKRGHHVIAFGRPEAGKSLFAINAACGFARQGYKGIYLINEDREEDIILRTISNLTNIPGWELEGHASEAIDLAAQNGFHNIIFVSAAPGTLEQIDRLMERYRPVWMVVDQLRNIQIKEDNRTVQLEKAATGIRTLGKKWDVAIVSVTQAGDSASDKAILDMSDVDNSKTGIPAQADLMVGIGVTDELEMRGQRYLSLPKNKLGGKHESFPVKIDPVLSKLTSV